MRRHSGLLRWVLSVFLFLLAFFPRAIQPVSRPLVWYLRSAHFIEAVLAGEWANTVYSEHPGVALMWPAGIGLKVYWTISGITPAAHTVPPDFEPIHFFGPVPVAEIAAALTPLALLIALGIVGIYLMLRRLFDEATAAVAGLLLVLSPYYLAQSKILHLDAWMATLMLLSALALLLYRREHHTRYLLLSGALGGLALLVKTPALFLFPFTALVLLVDTTRSTQHAALNLQSAIRNLLLWLLAAALVYVALWPAMWVDPARGLAAVRWGLTHHTSTAHDTPTFFLGRVLREDPSPLFYGVVLLFRTGEVELTFLAVAGVLGAAHLLRRRRLSQAGLDRLLLLAYAIFFLAQMCLGAKKMPRYVLPALLALDVLAAMGIVTWAWGIASKRRRLAALLMALPLLVQATLVLPRHPYYGTALNWLAGGPPAAARAILIGEEGEGLAELAAYLNARPDADQLTVAAQLKHVFNQTFRGTTVDIDQMADYLVFHRNYTIRDYKIEQWGNLWERYGARTPEREVSFDSVPYAWLYRMLPAGIPPEHPLPLRLSDRFRFLGYDLRTTQAAPGDCIPLVLYWQATKPVIDDLSVFVHLLDSSGGLVWQDDGAAAHGTRPTWSWAPGEVVADPHTVVLPENLPEGDYLLTAGLYDWRTGERLPAIGVGGAHLPADRLDVATLIVRRPRTHPLTYLARGLASLVILSSLPIVGRLVCLNRGFDSDCARQW
ncbi:MAG: hypothetical protein DRI79_06965 [Chloroflexi bacterium]|nr:MAG: hypothetical protein DRI79_06965 [Chloroflexota bacterium]